LRLSEFSNIQESMRLLARLNVLKPCTDGALPFERLDSEKGRKTKQSIEIVAPVDLFLTA
jgi:hypothetical protein